MIVITSMTELPHSCMGCPFQKNQKTPFCRAARNYKRGWSNIPAAFGFYIKDDAFPEGHTPWNSRAKWCPLKEVKGADRPQGKWKAKSFHECFCHNCGFSFDVMKCEFLENMKYCPNCGVPKGADDETEKEE